VIGPPVPPQPDTATVEVTPGSGFQDRREDQASDVPADLPQPATATPLTVTMPDVDTLEPMSGSNTDPAAQPRTGTAQGTLAAPPAQGQSARVEVGTDAPVLSIPQAILPAAPEADQAVNPPEPTAMPTQQEAAETAEDAVPSAPETTEPAPEIVEAAPQPETPQPDAAPEAETVAEATSEPDDAPEAASEPDTVAEAAPEPEDAPEAAPAPETVAEAAPEDAPATDPSSETTDEAAASDPDADAADEAPAEDQLGVRTGFGRPATSLIDRDAAPAPADAEDATPDPENDLPPLEAYAAEFENPEDKPLMSIVLIDRGEYPQIVDALDSFPYPVSFAVDPAWEGAPEAMARYRAAGRDVLVLADIPEGAAASDVEVNLDATLSALPEVVAVMEGDGTGLQGSRAVSDQVTAWLRDSGHGLVMYPQGLDTARKLAEREGVRAATLFRDFDSKEQDATVIRRFLDQAAFKAVQDGGGVIMVGRARPETISALILWGLADRADRVALAPVSALLQAGAGQTE